MPMPEQAGHYVTPAWGAPANVQAVMTTRVGGCSHAPFDGLNLGAHVGDDVETVTANRRQLVRELKLRQEPIWLNQVHSNRVVTPGETEGDAAYTQDVGMVLAIQVADCLPILICDRAGTEIAAIHAGWRGLATGVIAQTIDRFTGSELKAWVGPGILGCHYEVDYKLIEAFSDYPEAISSGRDDEHWFLDLSMIASIQLGKLQVTEVSLSGDCTYCLPERYFSYRRDGECGRMAAIIWLESPV